MTPDWSATAEPIPYAKLDNPQTLNLYAYVADNPTSFADPDGHKLQNPDAAPQNRPDPTSGSQTQQPQAQQQNNSTRFGGGSFGGGGATGSWGPATAAPTSGASTSTGTAGHGGTPAAAAAGAATGTGTSASSACSLPAQAPQSIVTPYGTETQSSSPAAQDALSQAQNGATLYRSGEMGVSMAGESQYWSLQNPLDAGYAQSMGAPDVSTNFAMAGTLQPGATAVTNEATALGANVGGGIQVVTESEAVDILWFVTF